MTVDKSFLSIALFLFLAIDGFSQATHQKTSLSEILQSVEQHYNITFTYLDENIKNIAIDPPPEKLTLQEVLEYLQKHTGLQYRQLSEKYVSISASKDIIPKVCGIIVNAETGEAIFGATIHYANEATVSNEDGYFELKNLSKNHTVIIRHLGYEIKTIPVSKLSETPCITLSLEQKTTTLQEVFVTNYITKGINKKIDGSIEINTDELGILPGLTEPDVLHTIQTLPGIQSIDETVSDINVRGGTNDQNLVLWDGIRMYQSGHFFGLISAFNPYLTKKVTLIKNGTSAKLGGGVSSTIDIRSDDQLAEKFSGGGGINLINGDVFTKIPLSKKASLQLSARRSIADVVQTPTYQQYFERAFRDTDVIKPSNSQDTLVNTNENFYFYDVNFKLLYDFTTKDKLRLNFLNVYNDIEYQENEMADDSVESKTSGLEQQNLAAGISYSRLWNNKFRTSAQLYLSWYQLGAVNFDILNDQRLIQENKILDTGMKLESRLTLTNNLDLFNGYQFMEVGIGNLEDINNPEFRRFVKKVIRTHAAFVEMDFTSNNNNTNARIGVRANYFEKFDKTIIEPRFAFNQKLFNNLYLEILGEMKSQTTAQIIDFQTDFLGIEKRRWVLSNNEDIPIIQSKQLSTGFHYKKNNLLINMEGYLKQVEGITSSSQGFQNQFQYERASGSYQAQGIDFLVSKDFGTITTWLSYSLANNTFTFDDFTPKSFPNNLDISHTITFGGTYHINQLELSTGFNWHTGKPFTEPEKEDPLDDNTINYQSPNSSRLDNYLRVDLSAKYVVKLNNNMRMLIGASLWNVLDKKNVINTYYHINDEDQVRPIQEYALGFTPNFNVRLQF